MNAVYPNVDMPKQLPCPAYLIDFAPLDRKPFYIMSSRLHNLIPNYLLDDFSSIYGGWFSI